MSGISDSEQPKRSFVLRRKRTLLSFRRRGDLTWFVASIAMFCIGLTTFIYTIVRFREPLMIERVTEPAPDASVGDSPPAAARGGASLSDGAAKGGAGLPDGAADAAPAPPAPPVVKAEEAAPAPAAPAREKKIPAEEKPPREIPRGGAVKLPLTFFDAHKTFKTTQDGQARLGVKTAVADGQSSLLLDFDLEKGDWARVFFAVNDDLRSLSRIHFMFQGGGADNTLEFGFIDAAGNVSGASWPHQTGNSTWTSADLQVGELDHVKGRGVDWSRIKQVFFQVSRNDGDQGGRGRVSVSNLRLFP